MYIQEVIMDGFKSYAQKTVINGFDPQFNAITGLNGTGKSNILDAICFVLGISNLSQVRVGNLQELVYKQGQAGVTKASVTIIFNNSDPSGSPIGYESHRQITVTRQVVIGGKNKYMINGHSVPQSSVQTMFHSVQLNVNNPHFLIMQGRITKVLNMKPMEILSMIEEAAGTRMFEDKKQEARKILERKQLRVDEISKCMDDEITPHLEGLRSGREDYERWQINNAEFDQVKKLCIAYEFYKNNEKLSVAEDDINLITVRQEQIGHLLIEKEAASQQCKVSMKEIENRESSIEGVLKELRLNESELSKSLVKVNTLYTNSVESLRNEQEVKNNLQNQLNASEVSKVKKTADLARCNESIVTKQQLLLKLEQEHGHLISKYESVSTGASDDQNATHLLSIPEQLSNCEIKESELQNHLVQNKQKTTHLEAVVRDTQVQLQAEKVKHANQLNEAETLRSGITKSEVLLKQPSGSEQDIAMLGSDLSTLRREECELQNNIDALSANLEATSKFEYKDPTKNFDRSKVKGLVATLIKVNESKSSAALEIVAGSKLFQVVVTDEVTGKSLIEKGQLKKRVTILPLNKINHSCVEASKMKTAQSIASSLGGTAKLALEFVGYEPEVKNAIEHVFGTTIVCDVAAAAKEIAFHPTIGTKTVTLEGDVFDPSGTLTGGSTGSFGELLTKMVSLNQMIDQIGRCKEQIALKTSQLKKMETEWTTYKELNGRIGVMHHGLELCEEKIKQSNYNQLVKKISADQSELNQLKQAFTEITKNVKALKEQIKILQKSENNSSKLRENLMKDIQNQMRGSQKQITLVKGELSKIRNEHDGIEIELNAIHSDTLSFQELLKTSTFQEKKLLDEMEALRSEVDNLKAQHQKAKNAVNENFQLSVHGSKEVKQLHQQLDKISKEVQQLITERKKCVSQIKELQDRIQSISEEMNTMKESHRWIQDEKHQFGEKETDFDFSIMDIDQLFQRQQDLKTTQEKLSKKINKKVLGMIENAESEYSELNRKRQVILNDKKKIETVIQELEVNKSKALQTTWVKVNHDFGSIFSTLLPGTQAKLEPSGGASSVTEGLEVKVAFQNVWKESLTELSGGQRSLLALSLILSLLLFKPAPMYILDEVDAALDLSHTQNIGMMLRTHFSSSQFIVVSLKEGMFNNANVIFRTRFVDGVSAVSRTVAGGLKNNSNLKTSKEIVVNNSLKKQQIQEEEEEEHNEMDISPVKKSSTRKVVK